MVVWKHKVWIGQEAHTPDMVLEKDNEQIR